MNASAEVIILHNKFIILYTFYSFGLRNVNVSNNNKSVKKQNARFWITSTKIKRDLSLRWPYQNTQVFCKFVAWHQEKMTATSKVRPLVGHQQEVQLEGITNIWKQVFFLVETSWDQSSHQKINIGICIMLLDKIFNRMIEIYDCAMSMKFQNLI